MFFLTAKAQDYRPYYKGVNTAEEQVFVKGQIKEGLQTYLNTFRQYDFVFLSDCFTALQIALYANDETALLAIADKATQNGLSPHILGYRMMQYVQTHPLYLKNKDTIMAMYKMNRPHYLKRIDAAALKKMTILFAYDQLQKNDRDGESGMTYTKRYKPEIKQTMDAVLQLVKEKGFPGDKLIGVEQDDILKELKQCKCDALDVYNNNKEDKQYNAHETQFVFDAYEMAAGMYFPMLIHYITVWNRNGGVKKYLVHEDDVYMQQIIKGNMHPKDLALLYDLPYTLGTDTVKVNPGKDGKFFYVGIKGVNAPELLPDAMVNRYRAMYFIAPIGNDRAKQNFLRAHKMFIGGGWWGCRA